MKDLIDRQAAIDALDALCDRECEYSKKQRSVMCGACRLGSAFDVIDELPSAQPYTEEEIQAMQDLEQAQLDKAYQIGVEEGLQSAQSEHTETHSCDYQRTETHDWIPVTERQPEYGVEVLTINTDGDYEINHIIDEEDAEWFFNGVIAWCELPEPYKEGQDGRNASTK
jgi:hypothetical protein